MTRLSTVSLRPCSLPRDCHVASLLAITGAMYRSARLTAGRGRPALPKRETTFQTSTCSRRYTCGRTRNAPTYSPESKYGHRRLASGGSPAGGRGTPLPYNDKFPSFVTRFASLTLVPPSPEGEGLNAVATFYCHFDRSEGFSPNEAEKSPAVVSRYRRCYNGFRHYTSSVSSAEAAVAAVSVRAGVYVILFTLSSYAVRSSITSPSSFLLYLRL